MFRKNIKVEDKIRNNINADLWRRDVVALELSELAW